MAQETDHTDLGYLCPSPTPQLFSVVPQLVQSKKHTVLGWVFRNSTRTSCLADASFTSGTGLSVDPFSNAHLLYHPDAFAVLAAVRCCATFQPGC